MTEIVVAMSSIFFNSVDLVGSFMHEKETSNLFHGCSAGNLVGLVRWLRERGLTFILVFNETN